MADLRSTTARLRRTFQYPTDDSSNDSPEVLDEEEQETLITTLAAENASRNEQFRLALLALPAISAIPYLLALLLRPRTAHLVLIALSSLASTAFLVWRLPPASTGIALLDAWSAPRPTQAQSRGATAAGYRDGEDEDGDEEDADNRYSAALSRTRQQQQHRRRLRAGSSSSSSAAAAASMLHRSPLEKHLPLLNAGLCVLLALASAAAGAAGREGRWPVAGLGGLPAGVYAVVLVAKVLMAGVDPESELGGLRYEYKGA